MKVSIKWLKQYVDLPDLDPEELAKRLTFAGIEVESITPMAIASHLVIGQIISCVPHPNSDHLHLLEVDCGNKIGILSIVCGAPNARQGLKVIVARVGAQLKEMTISDSQIRGVPSHGMCCSLSELGVDKKYLSEAQLAGIEELPLDAPVGEEDVLRYLGLDDTVLDLKLLANRSDCNAMINVAREVAALYECPLHLPSFGADQGVKLEHFRVGSSSKGCQAFAVKVMEGVTVQESPAWLKQTLQAMGVRPINNLVDIGNYVMLLTGQPVHMYDLDHLPERELWVRDDLTHPFTALDEKTYAVEKGDLAVTSGGEIMCLGGVMGSLKSGVSLQTKRLAIEAASFNAASVRRTSIRLNLSSESSMRFIKGFTPEMAVSTLKIAAQLVRDLAGVKTEYAIEAYDELNHDPRLITFDSQAINHRLGTDFSEQMITKTLERVGLELTKKNEHLYQALIPAHRIDITEMADLSEEVIRILGFEHVKSELPTLKTTAGGLTITQQKKQTLRFFLRDRGLDEILTYTLVSHEENGLLPDVKTEDVYRLLHPMSDDHGEVRTSLLPSMLATLRYNVARQARTLAFFEVSEIYTKKAVSTHLALGLYGFDAYQGSLKNIAYDFYAMKGLVESVMNVLQFEPSRYRIAPLLDPHPLFHPGQSAEIYFGKQKIGVFGVVHPLMAKHYDIDKASCLVAEINLTPLLEAVTSRKKMVPPARYPFVERDLALVCPITIPYAQVLKCIKQAGKDHVIDVQLFDVYEGEHMEAGYRSLAVRIIYQDPDHTLVESEIVAWENQIKEALARELSITLRG